MKNSVGGKNLLRPIQKTLNSWIKIFSRPTEFESSRSSLWWLVALLIAGFIFMELPRPSGWVGSFVHKEDGEIFLSDFLHGGFARTFERYSGYIHVAPRLIAGLCATSSGSILFPACVGASVSIVRLAIAVLAWPIFSAYSKSWAIGLLASVSTVFVPSGQWEVLGNITNLRWFLVAGAFLSLLVVSRKTTLLTLASAVGLLAALSDPLVILTTPLVLFRFFSSKRVSRFPSMAVGLGIAIQVLSFKPSDRGGSGIFGLMSSPIETLNQLIMRGPLTAQFGVSVNEIALKVLGAPFALVLVLLPLGIAIIANLPPVRSSSTNLANFFGFSGISLLLVTISFANLSDLSLNEYWAPATPSRYGLLAALFLTPALVLYITAIQKVIPKISWASLLSMASALALIAAILLDFRGDSWNTHGPTWRDSVISARESCLKSNADPIVSITPTDVPRPWVATLTCDWVQR